MKVFKRNGLLYVISTGLITLMLLLGIACTESAPAAAPIAPAAPAAPAVPAAPQAAPVVIIPGAPTSIPARATATRVLPTATVVQGAQREAGGTLRHAFLNKFDSMDGHLSRNFQMQVVLFALYNNLVQLGSDGDITPDLASNWDFSGDGKTITFHLQKGVKFHDGTSFDANSVKWNIDRVLDPETGSSQRTVIGGTVSSVEVIDSYTVKLHLSSPSRPLLAQLSERAGHILSPTAVQNLGEDFAKSPVGTGPYKISTWKLADVNTMTKNDSYWENGKPYFDEVKLQDVPDINVQIAMVRTGESDVVTYVTPASIEQVENKSGLKHYVIPGRTHGFRFIDEVEPYNDVNLRKAMGYAFNPQEIVDVYFIGRGQAAYSIAPPGSWAYNPDIKVYDQDIAKSKEYLAKAGHPNGVTVPVYCRGTTTEITRCEIFQVQLAKADIKAELITVPKSDYWASFKSMYPGHRSKGGMYYWSPRGDPHQSLHRVFHSLGGSNAGWNYSNSEYDKYLDEAVIQYDISKAKELYDKAQAVILNDAIFIPHAFPPEYTVMRDDIQGFAQPPDLRLRVKDLWRQK
jgi:peptide/nickel transport system substrate-binding protein